jgi:hypothetical protein
VGALQNRSVILFPFDKVIGYYQVHDFIGALIDLAYFGIPHMPFHGIFLAVSISA